MEKAQVAPDFTLPDQEGKNHSLSDYRGRVVLLYFYPKDMTPGCTAEACSFRDSLSDLMAEGIQVLGVSVDSVDSHKKFAGRYHLNFPILSDADKKVVQEYGVWGERKFMGLKYVGTSRESFLIGKDGVILKHYEKVNPLGHSKEVLKDAKALVR